MSSAAPETRRLFFALWPTAEQRRQLHQLAGQLGWESGGRLVPPENLHITLAFLGSVDEERRRCIENAADSLLLPAFSLEFDRIGYWSRPQVLWFGSSRTPEPLRSLARSLALAMAGCGLQPEKRPFAAHLTVRRKAVQAPAADMMPPFPWAVRDFALVESLTLPGGAQYRVLRRWPLTGAEPPEG